MKHPKLFKIISGLMYVLIVLFLSSVSTYAQSTATKKTAKKAVSKTKKAKAPQPTVSIKIDTATINVKLNPADVVGDFQISIIHIKFVVSGDTPTTDAPVKLVIDDYTALAKPQFDNATEAPSTSFSTTIAKSSFTGLGSLNPVVMPVVIKFKSPVNEKGLAYIKIDGQPEFVRLNFNQTVNRSLALLDSATTLQLDTFKKNTINQFPVKLYLKLGKAINGVDTSVYIVATGVGAMKNIKLTDTVYRVNIANADWNSKKDTVLTKNVNLIMQQRSPVIHPQDMPLVLGSDTHVVRLVPSKSLTKTNVLKLVETGNAKIVKDPMVPEGVAISHYANAGIDSTSLIHLKVRLKGPYDENHNQLLFTIYDTSSYIKKHFQLTDNLKTVSPDEWQDAIIHDGMLDVPLHVQTTNLVDSLNDVRFLEIVLVGQENVDPGRQKVTIIVKDSPFWAEVGTNFDLLDNIKTNNFYAGVFGYLKDIAGTAKGKKNLSFTGGVYESQSVTLGSSSASGFDYRDGSSTIPDPTSPMKPYQFFTDTGRIKTTTAVKNIGLFFSPQIRLTPLPTDEKGFHMYLSIYTEMLWQRVTASLDYSQTAKTNTTHTANLDSLNQNVPFKESEFDLDYKSHFVGFGLPIYIKDHDFSMYINGVYGLTNQRFVLVDNSDPLNVNQYSSKVQNIQPAYYNNVDGASLLNFAQPKSRWNSFYLFQYRLTEIKYGLTFSGEVRGLLLNGSKPVITLALSKKFDLKALLKPLVAPF